MYKNKRKEKALKLFEQGLDRKEMSEKLNCSLSTCDRYIKDFREKQGIIKDEIKTTNVITLNNDEYAKKLDEIISTYENMIDTLTSINKLIQEIPELFEKISVYDCEQGKLLHDIESATTYDCFINKSVEFKKLRNDRRLAKNKYYLALKLRDSLKAHKVHSAVFDEIKINITSVINYCKSAKYTPKQPKKYNTHFYEEYIAHNPRLNQNNSIENKQE